ncbi:MAG: glycosyltransferase family 9 protein [Phycisphaerae bacterium]|nr:glycosyltransferase family 9 protein [Phycisphaerae bacterium]
MAVFGSQPADVTRRSFQRILLMKPSSLGDIVHALPVLHALRRRFPDAQIDWMVFPPFGELLAHHPQINELVVFDRKRFSRVGWSPRITLEFLHFLRGLRRRRYDLIVDLQGLFRSGFIAWASGAPTRIGFAEAREAAWVFYTHRIPHAPENAHAVDRNLSVCPILGLSRSEVRFDLGLPREVLQKAEQLLERKGIGASRSFLAVAPGARWQTKRWRAERFAEVLNQLEPDLDVPPVLLGAPDEVQRCKEVARACRRPPINLAGKTSVLEMAAVLHRCRALLCQDSASAHLAVAFSRPVVCLIGPTHPGRTGPYGQLDSVVRLDVSCSPCYLRRLSQCRHGHRCMEDLLVAPVVETLRRVLKTSSEVPGHAPAEPDSSPGR